MHKSLEALKLDQRLLRRRGWISPDELERTLAELPDVSEKIDRSEPGSGGGGEGDQPGGESP